MKRPFIIATAATLMVPILSNAAEINVLSTQATEQAYRELVPQFEKATGHKVTTVFTGTLGAQKRLADGESYDMIIMSAPSIDAQIKAGKVVAGSRVDIAKSGVGVGVPKGALKPDISTTEALKKTLLAAKSIGYSTGPSGVYMVSLFEKLGLADQVKDKLKQTPTGVFVGTIIASREVEIGFQQVSELSNFPGVDYVGPLPADVQNTTVLSTGMIVDAKEAEALARPGLPLGFDAVADETRAQRWYQHSAYAVAPVGDLVQLRVDEQWLADIEPRKAAPPASALAFSESWRDAV